MGLAQLAAFLCPLLHCSILPLCAHNLDIERLEVHVNETQQPHEVAQARATCWDAKRLCLVLATLAQEGIKIARLIARSGTRSTVAAVHSNSGVSAQAVKKLQVLDKSFTVIPDPKKVANKKDTKFYVSSVPREVDMGFQDVFQAAHGKGWVSRQQLAQLPMWNDERAKQQLQAMVQEGVCMIDRGDPSGHVLYWFPVLAGGSL